MTNIACTAYEPSLLLNQSERSGSVVSCKVKSPLRNINRCVAYLNREVTLLVLGSLSVQPFLLPQRKQPHIFSYPDQFFTPQITMSRVTPPVNKFAQSIRSISSSAQAARPSALLDSNSRYLPRSIRDLKTECSTRKLKTSGNKAEVKHGPYEFLHRLANSLRNSSSTAWLLTTSSATTAPPPDTVPHHPTTHP